MKHSKVEGAYCLGVFQNGKDPTTLLGGKALNFSRSFKKFAFQSFYICYICHLHCMVYHSLCCWPSWTSILAWYPSLVSCVHLLTYIALILLICYCKSVLACNLHKLTVFCALGLQLEYIRCHPYVILSDFLIFDINMIISICWIIAKSVHMYSNQLIHVYVGN
jgi:hypothetical protein